MHRFRARLGGRPLTFPGPEALGAASAEGFVVLSLVNLPAGPGLAHRLGGHGTTTASVENPPLTLLCPPIGWSPVVLTLN